MKIKMQSLAKYCVKAVCPNTHIRKRVCSVLSSQPFLVFGSNLAFLHEKGGGFMKKIFMVIAAIVLMPAIASALDFEMSLTDKINSFNVEASASGGPDRVTGALAMELGVKQEFILRQKTMTGLSWGDLSVALYISNRTGKDITIIVNDYKKGTGNAWGRVAKQYAIRTDDLLTTMGKAHAAAQHGRGHGKMGKGEGEGGFKEKKEHGKGGGGGKGKGH